MTRSSRMRRWGRNVGRTAAVLVALLGVAVLLLLVRPVRESILDRIMAEVEGSLPGTLEVGRAGWPGLGVLTMDDLVWTVDDDTLAVVRALRLDVDLSALRRRDLLIRDLGADCVLIDVPKVQGVMTRAGGEPAAQGGSSSLLRSGALPPLPSLAVVRSDLACGRLIVSPNASVDGVHVVASAELRAEREPEWSFVASARDATGRWRLEDAALTWAPARDLYEGGGSLVLGEDRRVGFTMARLGERRFALGIGAVPGSGSGLTADGRLGGGGTEPRRLDIEAAFLTPGLQDLAALPLVSVPTEDLPQFEGLAGSFTAALIWRPEGPDVTVDLTFEPNAWLDHGNIRLSGGRDALHLDTLALAAAGVELEASGSMAGEQCEARATLALTDDRWTALLPADVTPPDSLAGRLDLEVSGLLPTPAMEMAVGLGLRSGGARLDSLICGAGLEDGWTRGGLDIAMGAHGATVRCEADLAKDGDSLVIRPSPVVIGGLGVDGRSGAGARSRAGEVVVDLPQGKVVVSGLRATGVLGDLAVDARQDAGGFEARIDVVWPEPPAALLAVCADSLRAGLSAAWADGAPWDLRITASDVGDGPAAEATMRIPGPSRFEPLAPEGWDLTGLGPLMADLRLETVEGVSGFVMDLSRTSWIDEGRVEGSYDAEGVVLDAVGFDLLGMSVRGWASLPGDAIAAGLHVGVDDADRILAIVGSDLDADVTASLDAEFGGTRAAPVLGCDLEATFLGEGIDVPAVDGRIDVTAESLHVVVSADDVVLQGRTIDTASLRYEGPLPGRGTGRAVLAASGREASLFATLDAAVGEAVTVVMDTLDVEVAGRSLSLDRPVRIEAGPGPESTVLHAMAMSGDLGRIEADARLTGDGPAGDLVVELRLPDSVYPDALMPEMRPDEIAISASARGPRREARIAIRGLEPGDRRDLLVVADVVDGAEGIDVTAAAIDLGDTLATAAILVDRDAIGGLMPLHADLEFRGLPLPTLPGADWEGREVVLDGTVSLRGDTAAPSGSARIVATARNWSELAAHRLRFEGLLTPSGAPGAGVRTTVVLTRGDSVLANLTLGVPGAASLDPPGFVIDEQSNLEAGLTTSDLRLEEFAPLLPVAVGLRGRLDVQLGASGPPGSPGLHGELSLRDGRVALPDGSWFTMKGRSSIRGTPFSPDVTGSLEIGAGVLRLPEPPQNLHPVHARPVLWEASVAAGLAPPAKPMASPRLQAVGDSLAVFTPKAVLGVSIPTGLRLQGQGLEVVLLGDLEMRTADGRHDIGGALAATQGFFRFLGRTFEVERGDVSFDDGEGTDPALDIALTTLLEGTLYRVAFGGTLLRPTLTLTSEPGMPEGDIMAMLLFGRPLDELSSDQEGLVQDRAADLVTAYGTAQLEARLSQQLKVDMINLKRGGEGDDALVIGKHLHQKVLLKYEQELDAWSSFFVNLEYFFSRHVKLETMISRHDQSAAAVNWTKEY